MFPPREISPSSRVLPVTKIFRLIAIGILFFSLQHRTEAAGTLISAPARVDMVYDSARDIVYITSGSSVLRYQLCSNTFLSPFELGGSLNGIDLSPDGDVLTVITVSQGTKGGTVTINGGGIGVTFKPRINYTGIDTFTYKVSDGKGGTATATVTVTVNRK